MVLARALEECLFSLLNGKDPSKDVVVVVVVVVIISIHDYTSSVCPLSPSRAETKAWS